MTRVHARVRTHNTKDSVIEEAEERDQSSFPGVNSQQEEKEEGHTTKVKGRRDKLKGHRQKVIGTQNARRKEGIMEDKEDDEQE